MDKNDTFLVLDKPDIKIEPLTNCQLKRYISGDGYKCMFFFNKIKKIFLLSTYNVEKFNKSK